jgi:hypothetical protein
VSVQLSTGPSRSVEPGSDPQDVIAPTRQLARAVLANFRQVAGDREVFVHPIVARLVDPKWLKKVGAEPTRDPGQTIN